MKPIGGFLDLELAREAGRPYHEAAALSTGRSCFFFILQSLQPARVYLPYYICDTLIEPLLATGIPYRFYSLDASLEISTPPPLTRRDEVLVYVNYFGLKSRYIPELQQRYRDQLVLDDTQAFFQKGYPGTWSFNSARKFFGVPDGAYLYGPDRFDLGALSPATPAYHHLINRMIGKGPEAYRQFLEYEAGLDHQLRAMSELSTHMLDQVDYEAVAARRRSNFHTLHEALGPLNLLDWTLEEGQVPLYYPFLSSIPLRRNLIKREIFVPQLWPEVQTRRPGFAWEKQLARALSPLPVDQRYQGREMACIIDEVTSLLTP